MRKSRRVKRIEKREKKERNGGRNEGEGGRQWE